METSKMIPPELLCAGAIPEWVRSGPWTVTRMPGIGAHCNPKTRELAIGELATPWIVAHELAHAAFSPDPKTAGPMDIYAQCVEDMRVSNWLARNGLPMGPQEWELVSDTIRRQWEAGQVRNAILLQLSTGIQTREESNRLAELIPDAWLERVRKLHNTCFQAMRADGNSPVPYKRGKKLAKTLRESLEFTLEELKRPRKESGDKTVGSAEHAWDAWKRSCPMDIVTPALRPGRHAGTKLREEGSSLARPDRLHIDGRIFGQKRRNYRKGTVLIDASGSMDITPAILAKLTQAIPFGTIAYYSGGGVDGQCRGELVVAGRNGKVMANPRQSIGGNNLVDCHAIEWLAGMPGPRYYVGDQAYTSNVNSREAQELGFAEANKRLQDMGAHIIPDAETALDKLT